METEVKAPIVTKEVKYKITKGAGRASYTPFVLDGKTWKPLRPAQTTFDSAQMAIFDDMTLWAFPARNDR